jgi:glycosyltransferase involved in cell wall biosynthesis
MTRKILIATTVPETIATILKGQPKWLNQHFEVALMTSSDRFFSRIFDNEGIRPLFIPMKRRISPVSDLRSIFVAYRRIRHLRPDIVHSYTPKAGLVLMLASFLARVPIRIHSFTGLLFPTSRGFRRLLLLAADWLICRCATHAIAEGKGVARDLQEAKITNKPLVVLGNGNIAGVDTDYYDPDIASLYPLARDIKDLLYFGVKFPILGYVGRLNRDKGICELLAAVQKVNSKLTERGLPNCKLICVGEDDESAPLPYDTKAAMEADPHIILAGFREDVRPYLLAMDVLILPSYREGFPNVLLQGSSMAVPLIATDINGSNEIIVHGETGLLVKPRDVEALANAIQSFLESTDEARTKMGQAGRQRIKQLFSQPVVRNALLNYYEELVNSDIRRL